MAIIIRDTGHGMNAKIMERIFDPYYTTKGPGEGSGIGLAVVQGIIKGHGGTITVNSKLCKGAAFQVFLPRVYSPYVPDPENLGVREIIKKPYQMSDIARVIRRVFEQ